MTKCSISSTLYIQLLTYCYILQFNRFLIYIIYNNTLIMSDITSELYNNKKDNGQDRERAAHSDQSPFMLTVEEIANCEIERIKKHHYDRRGYPYLRIR